MPEGPEVHRAARRIGKALEGQTLTHVGFGFERLRPWERQLEGATTTRVEARGKGFLLHFDAGVALYVHLQLYGRWYVRKAGSWPRTNRSLRAELHTDRKMALLYSASDVAVLDPASQVDHPYLRKLGPDPLDGVVTEDDIRSRVRDPAFARRRLGGLLLDQGFVAGMGNYLRSEVLFDAGILPSRRPMDLDPAEVEALSQALWTLPRRSLKTGGVTAPPEVVDRAKAAGEPRRQWRHLVFARAGRPCPRCGATIEKLTVAGRRLYACDRCQH
ncbi:MAG: endonuclease VIII [Myxococcota bacterium]|nr:endonuclease VIII [Myxococcota bacterium]MEC8423333.1 endonuclease VIII [Myxococcota bacterium]